MLELPPSVMVETSSVPAPCTIVPVPRPLLVPLVPIVSTPSAPTAIEACLDNPAPGMMSVPTPNLVRLKDGVPTVRFPIPPLSVRLTRLPTRIVPPIVPRLMMRLVAASVVPI